MKVPSTTVTSAALEETSAPLPRAMIRELGEDHVRGWDEFVWQQSKATFFHLTGWKRVIEQTFGFRPRYLLAERGSRITGILPLFEISNWIQGKCLVSTPMAVYGGICAEDRESHTALLDAAKRMAQSEGVQHLELRQQQSELFPEFHPNKLYTAFCGELDPNPDEMLRRLPRDTRYMIRKAQKNEMSVERGVQGTPAFYRLFLQSMHRLGTPALPLRFFENLIGEFKTLADVLVLSSKLGPVAAVFSFRFRDTILPYYAGASPEAPRLAANNLLYWELMARSAAEGLRKFDFGRSKQGTGAYAFKTQWNMVAQPLDYQMYLVKRKSVPNFTPLNPKFERAANVWSKLPPALAARLGPHVVRWFP